MSQLRTLLRLLPYRQCALDLLIPKRSAISRNVRRSYTLAMTMSWSKPSRLLTARSTKLASLSSSSLELGTSVNGAASIRACIGVIGTRTTCNSGCTRSQLTCRILTMSVPRYLGRGTMRGFLLGTCRGVRSHGTDRTGAGHQSRCSGTCSCPR